MLCATALLVASSGCARWELFGDPGLESQARDPAATGSGSSSRLSYRRIEDLPPLPASRVGSATTGAGDQSAHGDLWARVREGMQIQTTHNDRIAKHIEWLAKHQGYLDRVSDRAAPYLHYVVAEVRKRELPAELALLPMVESGYRPFARSPSGAAGIWQFISSTGKRYGLEQNWWYDGRRDIVQSTRAALEYLERLHRQFDGDWLLAIAAYNAGQGTVKAAMKRNEEAGKPTDFWSLELKRETQKYVPNLLALSAVVAEPHRFGLSLATIDDTPYFQVVRVGRQIDLATAAEMAGVTIEDLYLLNPGFNRWASAPDGPHRLLLPVTSVVRFEDALSRLTPEELLSWKRHEIERGDTLLGLAGRYHTSVAALREVNDLRGDLLKAGRSLLVPVSARPLDHYTLSADARGQPAAGEGTRVRYTVRSGDSLWRIARRHQTTVEQLARWNGIASGAVLKPGQELVVWRTSAVAALAPATVMPASYRGPGAALRVVKYTVRRGDSLWTIARRFKVSVASLRKWNDLARAGLLHPGQELDVHIEPGQYEI